jgi:hypothetical protein
MNELSFAGAIVSPTSASVRISGETFSAGMQEGSARAYSVSVPDGGLLEIATIYWDSGDRDVRTITRLAGPVAYDRLTKGLRLGVSTSPGTGFFCELGIATHHTDKQPTVVRALPEDLELMLGQDVGAMFASLGATAYGTREDIMGETNKRRFYLGVTFPDSAVDVPIAAYVLTRVLPIMKGFGRKGAVPVGQA